MGPDAVVERRFNRVTLSWAGGQHDFALNIGELRAVQEVCRIGPLGVLRRLQGGTWLVDDVLAPLRHGLDGAGMDSTEARALMLQVQESTPLMRLAITAQLVLAAALIGMEDDEPGKDEAPAAEGETTHSAAGASPESTATES